MGAPEPERAGRGKAPLQSEGAISSESHSKIRHKVEELIRFIVDAARGLLALKGNPTECAVMKRLLLALLLLLAPEAGASPELADQFGLKASGLYEDTVAAANALRSGGDADLLEDYIDELSVFAGTALKLGSWSDAQAGASDFGCIFRGMAEEADVQLLVLETASTASEKRTALSRLIAMFDDAQSIAAAASHAARRAETERGGTRVAAAPSCAANPADLQLYRP